MIIKTLVEDTSLSCDFSCEHGLSLYIKTKDHNILFDTGQSGMFLKNAKRLGVDIEKIDIAVISHGHYDHGGGIKQFLQKNSRAELFLHNSAFEKHYSLRSGDKMEYIGLDEEIKRNNRIVYTSDRFFISKGIQLFSNINKFSRPPLSNKNLLIKKDSEFLEDTFSHEQNLIVEEEGKTLLTTGCAHNGIVNIIEHFHNMKKRMPNYVIGGFHLSSRSKGAENPTFVKDVGTYLLNTGAKYYTCHCTGLESYERLKDIMGDKIEYLSTGSQIII